MFPSGSFKEYFAVSPAVQPWCSQPVKPKMRQNGVLEMNRSGTFRMYPSLPPQCTTFGEIRVNFGNTAGKCLGNWKTWDIQNVPSIFPKFTRILPKVVHCGGNDGYILNVPLRFISSTPFWRILGFTGWEHHGCTAGDTAKYSLNEPLGNIAVTFFGKLEVYPTYYLMGTSWLHDLEHCECVRATRSTTNSSTRTRRGPRELGKLVLISTTKHKGTS